MTKKDDYQTIATNANAPSWQITARLWTIRFELLGFEFKKIVTVCCTKRTCSSAQRYFQRWIGSPSTFYFQDDRRTAVTKHLKFGECLMRCFIACNIPCGDCSSMYSTSFPSSPNRHRSITHRISSSKAFLIKMRGLLYTAVLLIASSLLPTQDAVYLRSCPNRELEKQLGLGSAAAVIDEMDSTCSQAEGLAAAESSHVISKKDLASLPSTDGAHVIHASSHGHAAIHDMKGFSM